jgi:leucyl-tRNA synthetase
VAPDEVVGRYGADTLRLYILSVAPPELPLEWSEESIAGSHRLIQRIWRLVDRYAGRFADGTPPAKDAPPAAARDLRRKVHQTIQRVTGDIEERLHLNTAVAAFHELVNEIYRSEETLGGEVAWPVLREAIETQVVLLAPFTPHVAEEMWARLGHREGLVDHPWPEADPDVAREASLELAVQVNGKVRGHVVVAQDADDETIRRAAAAELRIAEHLKGRKLVKAVVVPGRLVSFVVR